MKRLPTSGAGRLYLRPTLNLGWNLRSRRQNNRRMASGFGLVRPNLGHSWNSRTVDGPAASESFFVASVVCTAASAYAFAVETEAAVAAAAAVADIAAAAVAAHIVTVVANACRLALEECSAWAR